MLRNNKHLDNYLENLRHTKKAHPMLNNKKHCAQNKGKIEQDRHLFRFCTK